MLPKSVKHAPELAMSRARKPSPNQKSQDKELSAFLNLIQKHLASYPDQTQAPGSEFFEVMILATMSSGKSTLLNAMLGTELMPTSNEACTARIFQIDDIDGQNGFEVNRNEAWETATQSSLTSLNAEDLEQDLVIHLRGDVVGVANHSCKLSIFDTPGPNNSRDASHRKVTSQLLKDGNFGAVIYVMNATQFGVHDDALLLEELREVERNPDKSHKRVIFALNKVDQLDPEKGETIQRAVADANEYLLKKGFSNPIIIPISALLALQARIALTGGPLKRRDKHYLRFHAEGLGTEESTQLLRHAQLPIKSPQHDEYLKALSELVSDSCSPCAEKELADGMPASANTSSETAAHQRSGYSKRQLEYLLMSSGVRTLEALLDELVRTAEQTTKQPQSRAKTRDKSGS